MDACEIEIEGISGAVAGILFVDGALYVSVCLSANERGRNVQCSLIHTT